MVQKLPFRPAPESDESLHGYVLRLTHWYEFPSAARFAREVLDCAVPGCIPLRSVRNDQLLAGLRAAGALAHEEHFCQWGRLNEEHRIFDDRRIVKDISIDQPRICPGCLLDHGYFRYKWQLAHVVECSEHKMPLLGSCPVCASPFKWKSCLFEGCEVCQTAWSDHRNHLTLETSAGEAAGAPADLNKLYQAFLHACMPLGHSAWQRPRLEFFPQQHNKLMAIAYGLITDGNYNDQFIAMARGDWHHLPEICGAVLELRASNIRELLCEETSLERGHSTPDISFPEAIEPQLPPQHRKLMSEGFEPAWLANTETTGKVLGLTVPDMNQLVDRHLFSCVKGPRLLRDRVFNLFDINNEVRQMFAASQGQTTHLQLTFAEGRSFAERFGLDLKELVLGLQTGQLPFYRNESQNGFQAFAFDRHQLLQFCEERFAELPEKKVSLKEAMTILALPEAALKYLVSKKYLRAEWATLDKKYSISELRRFLSRFRVARREAAVTGMSIEKCWRRILSGEARPVLEKLEGGHFLGIAQSVTPSQASAA